MMFKHKLMANDSTGQAFKASREQFATLVQEHPWLIPATVALEVLPATAMIHGYWKLRQLKNSFKLRRNIRSNASSNALRPIIAPMAGLNY
ncbi:Transposase [Levilactobacillus brevis]|nr:Transposase [Levilactobacillus brevis]